MNEDVGEISEKVFFVIIIIYRAAEQSRADIITGALVGNFIEDLTKTFEGLARVLEGTRLCLIGQLDKC